MDRTRRYYISMGILNKLVDHGSKLALVLLGLAVALLPLIFLFGHETLHHQAYLPAF